MKRDHDKTWYWMTKIHLSSTSIISEFRKSICWDLQRILWQWTHISSFSWAVFGNISDILSFMNPGSISLPISVWDIRAKSFCTTVFPSSCPLLVKNLICASMFLCGILTASIKSRLWILRSRSSVFMPGRNFSCQCYLRNCRICERTSGHTKFRVYLWTDNFDSHYNDLEKKMCSNRWMPTLKSDIMVGFYL